MDDSQQQRTYLLTTEHGYKLKLTKLRGNESGNGFNDLIMLFDVSGSMKRYKHLLETSIKASIDSGAVTVLYSCDACVFLSGEDSPPNSEKLKWEMTNYEAGLKAGLPYLTPDSKVFKFTDGNPNTGYYEDVLETYHTTLEEGTGFLQPVYFGKCTLGRELNNLGTPGKWPIGFSEASEVLDFLKESLGHSINATSNTKGVQVGQFVVEPYVEGEYKTSEYIDISEVKDLPTVLGASTAVLFFLREYAYDASMPVGDIVRTVNGSLLGKFGSRKISGFGVRILMDKMRTAAAHYGIKKSEYTDFSPMLQAADVSSSKTPVSSYDFSDLCTAGFVAMGNNPVEGVPALARKARKALQKLQLNFGDGLNNMSKNVKRVSDTLPKMFQDTTKEFTKIEMRVNDLVVEEIEEISKGGVLGINSGQAVVANPVCAKVYLGRRTVVTSLAHHEEVGGLLVSSSFSPSMCSDLLILSASAMFDHKCVRTLQSPFVVLNGVFQSDMATPSEVETVLAVLLMVKHYNDTVYTNSQGNAFDLDTLEYGFAEGYRNDGLHHLAKVPCPNRVPNSSMALLSTFLRSESGRCIDRTVVCDKVEILQVFLEYATDMCDVCSILPIISDATTFDDCLPVTVEYVEKSFSATWNTSPQDLMDKISDVFILTPNENVDIDKVSFHVCAEDDIVGEVLRTLREAFERAYRSKLPGISTSKLSPRTIAKVLVLSVCFRAGFDAVTTSKAISLLGQDLTVLLGACPGLKRAVFRSAVRLGISRSQLGKKGSSLEVAKFLADYKVYESPEGVFESSGVKNGVMFKKLVEDHLSLATFPSDPYRFMNAVSQVSVPRKTKEFLASLELEPGRKFSATTINRLLSLAVDDDDRTRVFDVSDGTPGLKAANWTLEQHTSYLMWTKDVSQSNFDAWSTSFAAVCKNSDISDKTSDHIWNVLARASVVSLNFVANIFRIAEPSPCKLFEYLSPVGGVYWGLLAKSYIRAAPLLVCQRFFRDQVPVASLLIVEGDDLPTIDQRYLASTIIQRNVFDLKELKDSPLEYILKKHYSKLPVPDKARAYTERTVLRIMARAGNLDEISILKYFTDLSARDSLLKDHGDIRRVWLVDTNRTFEKFLSLRLQLEDNPDLMAGPYGPSKLVDHNISLRIIRDCYIMNDGKVFVPKTYSP
jgi:hypothetical protein